MGWTFTYGKPWPSIKGELDSQLTFERNGATRRVLKSSMVGSTYYAAVEMIGADGKREVWAAVFLTSKKRDEWGYKDMDESMGPVASNCPAGILALLTEPVNESAKAWRDRCRANLAAKRPGKKATAGDIVTYGGLKYRLLKPAGPRRGWMVEHVDSGALFRMKANQLSYSARTQA